MKRRDGDKGERKMARRGMYVDKVWGWQMRQKVSTEVEHSFERALPRLYPRGHIWLKKTLSRELVYGGDRGDAKGSG